MRLMLFLLLPIGVFGQIREKVIGDITSQLNVREIGNNAGPMVSKYLKSVGSSDGNPWCAAFVSYNLTKNNIKNPNSAWSPAFAQPKDIIWTPRATKSSPLPADVMTLYYPSLGRVGHVGFYVNKDLDGNFITIEGNTNGEGSREGDGVYRKKRHPNKVYAITRYIK